MTNSDTVPVRRDRLRAIARRLLVIGVIGVAVVVILRLLNRIDLVVTPPPTGGVLLLVEAKFIMTAMVHGITGVVLAFGLASCLAIGIRQRWNWMCGGLVVALVAAWAGFETLASFFVSDQSPTRWPWWAYDVASALGTISCLTGFTLLGFLVIWRFLRYFLADMMVTARI